MNYSELKSHVADWLHRDDLTAKVPTFIALAEERFNRDLRVRDMETALTATAIVDYAIALPAGTLDVKLLWRDDDLQNPLTVDSLEGVKRDQNADLASRFAHQGSSLVFNGTGTVTGVLYAEILALSDTNTTNWLLTKAFSAYLFGALVESAIYTGEDPTIYQAKLDAALASITGNENRLAGPLVARKR